MTAESRPAGNPGTTQEVTRRLVFVGYRQPTLIAAKTAAIAIVAAAVAGYTAVILLAFWRPGLAG